MACTSTRNVQAPPIDTWHTFDALHLEYPLIMEKAVARVRFENVDDGGEESSASEAELSERADVSSDEEEESRDEARKMVAQQNRKGKKSGGFQSMGTPRATFTNNIGPLFDWLITIQV